MRADSMPLIGKRSIYGHCLTLKQMTHRNSEGATPLIRYRIVPGRAWRRYGAFFWVLLILASSAAAGDQTTLPAQRAPMYLADQRSAEAIEPILRYVPGSTIKLE